MTSPHSSSHSSMLTQQSTSTSRTVSSAEVEQLPTSSTRVQDNPKATRDSGSSVTTSLKVAICICTCRRLGGLKALLAGLDRLEFHQIPTPEISLIVVDNDAAEEAFRLCQTLKTRWPLHCVVESKRGISYARNTSITAADHSVDFLALIDDDEVPEPCWLEELLLTQQKSQADFVQGPVPPRFHTPVENWIQTGKFFEVQRRSTGTVIDYAYAGNLLARAEILKSLATPFDERFSLTGGEDSYLFRNLHHQGYKIVWSDEAVAYESVPDSRLNEAWLMRRGYRSCLTYSRWQQECFPGKRTQLKIAVKGIACIGLGGLQFITTGLQGKAQRVKAKVKIARGAGCLSSLMGITYQEYNVIHSV